VHHVGFTILTISELGFAFSGALNRIRAGQPVRRFRSPVATRDFQIGTGATPPLTPFLGVNWSGSVADLQLIPRLRMSGTLTGSAICLHNVDKGLLNLGSKKLSNFLFKETFSVFG
jgi:hypothetical protein